MKLNTSSKQDIIPINWEMRGDWMIASTIYRQKSYAIQAKIYTENCYQAIRGGKVLKLWIKCNNTNKVIFEYDRGFNIGNLESIESGVVKKILNTIETIASEMTGTIKFGYNKDWLEALKRCKTE